MVEVVLVAMKAKRVCIGITLDRRFAVVSNTYLDCTSGIILHEHIDVVLQYCGSQAILDMLLH